MANITTVTRPYARAILALAKEQGDYQPWSTILQFLAQIANDKLGYKVLSNLAMTPAEKVEFLFAVGQDILNDQAKHVIKVLARGKRLLILPELYALYEALRKEAEGLLTIDLAVAENINRAEYDQIIATCSKEFGEKVTLREHIDPALISGGKAQIGNRVVDASVFGRLNAMRVLLRK